MFNSGAEATLEVEDEGEYTIIVNISFDKSNLSQSTVNVNANGTTMVVIQTNGTDGNWITPVSYTHLDVYKRQAVYFF